MTVPKISSNILDGIISQIREIDQKSDSQRKRSKLVKKDSKFTVIEEQSREDENCKEEKRSTPSYQFASLENNMENPNHGDRLQTDPARRRVESRAISVNEDPEREAYLQKIKQEYFDGRENVNLDCDNPPTSIQMFQRRVAAFMFDELSSVDMRKSEKDNLAPSGGNYLNFNDTNRGKHEESYFMPNFTIESEALPLKKPDLVGLRQDFEKYGLSNLHTDGDLTVTKLVKDNEKNQQYNDQLKAIIIKFREFFAKVQDDLQNTKADYEHKMMLLKMKKQSDQQERKIDPEGMGEAQKLFITSDLWKVVITIMSGIEMSVKAFDFDRRQYNTRAKDYKMKNYFEIHHPSLDMYKLAQFVDYAPTIFNFLRKMSGIFHEIYLESLGPDSLSKIITGNMDTFKGIQSSGKSGSFFFTSGDKRYLVKTISKDERRLLIDLLPSYFMHLNNNPKSLISKIYGLHKLVMTKLMGISDKWSLVVMQNIFATNKKIDKLYDLKGSTYGRLTK